MMKRMILLAAAFMLLTAVSAGCGARELPEVLLSIDGEPAVTSEDLAFEKEKERLVSAYAGDRTPSEKEAFLRLATAAICARAAEDYSVAADREKVEAEYRILLDDIAGGSASAADAYVLEGLREKFKDRTDGLYVKNVYLFDSRTFLADDIAATFRDAGGADAIDEYIDMNISAIAGMHSIETFYPGLEKHEYAFTGL